jgi:hypothetical protein
MYNRRNINMTNERFWKIADKYEVTIDSAIVIDKDSAMKEIVYYNRGDVAKSISDYSLLIKSNYGGNKEFIKVVDTIKGICEEFKQLGRIEFKKKYKNILTN